MKFALNNRLFLSLWIFISAVFFIPSNALADDGWIGVRSKNFYLTGNAPEEEIRQVAVQLEQFRAFFRRIFRQVNFDSPIPTTVIVFKNEESFRNYKPADRKGNLTDWAGGYFLGGEDGNYIILSAKSEKAKTFRTIFHEYTHFLIDNEFGRARIPPWLNEGLAEYYEMFQIENDRKITLGIAIDEHLRLLRQNRLIRAEAFFYTDYYTLHLKDRENAVLFYAQSWALIHYLMHGRKENGNRQFEKFVELIQTGQPVKEAFSEAFRMDFLTVEQKLEEYIKQKTLPTSVLTLEQKLAFDDTLHAFPVSESQTKAILSNLLYHLNRLEAAAEHAEEALQLDENSAPALITLGLVRMKQKNFPEAQKFLEKAISADEKNYLAHYRYAFVLSREGMSDYGFVSGYDYQNAEKMRRALKKAIALNPDFAQSYNLFALVSVARNEELDQAFEYIEKALKLAPGNQWLQIRKAELLMRKEDFDTARQMVIKIYQTAADENLRIYALNRIYLINSLESQLEAVRYNKRLKEVPDTPLTDEEFARLREISIVQGINQGLRKPQKDEIRILGYLTRIECAPGGVEYSVKTEEKMLRLKSKDFENLLLVSFTGETLNTQIGCDSIKNEILAVITYRPGSKVSKKSAGEIIAIEFVPKNFRFITANESQP